MNIIQMKQEIKDIRTELAAEIDKGMEMAKNRATTLESIKAQSDKVDDLQIREALLMQALNTAEGKENPPQSKKLGQNGGFRSLGLGSLRCFGLRVGRLLGCGGLGLLAGIERLDLGHVE